jgi:hypothetical protein
MYPIGPKSTWLKQAEDIASGKMAIKNNDIPSLLRWLKDYNWPGANIISNYLPKYEIDLVLPMREILHSQDMIWIYWLCSALLVNCSREVCLALRNDLKQIACSHDEDGAHIAALELLEKHKLN